MFITILVIIFIAVFGFITWRVLTNASSGQAKTDEDYVCPVCNEQHCLCERKES